MTRMRLRRCPRHPTSRCRCRIGPSSRPRGRLKLNNPKPQQILARILAKHIRRHPRGIPFAVPIREQQHVNPRFALGIDAEDMALWIVDGDAGAGPVAGAGVVVAGGVVPCYGPGGG